MNRIIYLPVLNFFFIFCLNTSISAQMQAIAGYNHSKADAKVLNDIIEKYNMKHPELSQPMSSLNRMNGMMLGLRYPFPYFCVEFDWLYQTSRLKDRIINADRTTYQNIIYFRNQSFSLSGELYYKWIGMGASIDVSQTLLRKERSSDTAKETLINSNNLTNNVHISFELPINDVLSIRIRPYIQLPTRKPVNFAPVEAKFNPDVIIVDKTVYNQRITYYGISIAFVNGNQRN